ncbi:MAG TPA: Na+/H+ antiporter NhaC family protein [Longimicrobiales bacterium]|nr:Na+/H+ antiporter NhaC family protein [Longimicrobiales bacterium]
MTSEPRRSRVPHTLVLLFGMIVLALLLTWVLPAGQYERVENEHGRMQVVPGSYEATPDHPTLSPITVFTAVPRGLEAAAEIIFFVFIIGGAFAVLRETGAIDALLGAALRRLGHRPLWLLIGGVLIFMAGSSTIGMAEEYLPFIPVLVALALALGYDALTGVAIVTIGYSVGYGVATINPFTVLIAQDVAGLQPASGLWYRLVLTAVFVPIGVHHLWRYAARVKNDPSRSLVADIPPPAASTAHETAMLTGTHRLALVTVAITLAVLIYGLTRLGWYLVEMSALFLALALALALVGRIDGDRAARAFGTGAAELTMTALLIGFARAIQVVLDDGGVIDTIVHGLSVPLQTMGPALAAVGMLVVQTLTNFLIPSGSGQAYVTMPIMAPLADVVGVSRQVAVLAFQFGDGFTNILVPTNPVIIGMLAIAGVPYDRWLRFVLPFMLKVWAVAAIALAAGVWLGVE